MDTSSQYPLISELTNNHTKICKRRNSKNGLDAANSRDRSRSPRSAIKEANLMVNNPILDDDEDYDNTIMSVKVIKREPKCIVTCEMNREEDRENDKERNEEKGRERGREKDNRKEEHNLIKRNPIFENERTNGKGREGVRGREFSSENGKVKNKDISKVDISRNNGKIRDDKKSENGDELSALYDQEKDRNNDYEHDHNSDSDSEEECEHRRLIQESNLDHKQKDKRQKYEGEEYEDKDGRGRRKNKNENKDDDEDDEDEDDEDEDDDEDNEEERNYQKRRGRVIALDMERVRNIDQTSTHGIRTIKSKEKGKDRLVDHERNGGEGREVRESSRSPRHNDSRSRPHLIGVRR